MIEKFGLLIILGFVSVVVAKPGITYDASGRLGDQLICYAIAKHLSLKHQLPFYYRPFKYAEALQLSKNDPVLMPASFAKYSVIEIGHELPSKLADQDNFLYMVGFQHWQVSSHEKQWYGINPEPNFRRVLKELIAPVIKLPRLNLDQNAINVAMHVRKGDGIDAAALVASHYEKFPTENFFIAALQRIQAIFAERALYVYIFTDVYDSMAIKKRYEDIFKYAPNICFATRAEYQATPWDQNVLEDLFKMTQFDCLIRPRSAYSAVAQAIGNHKVVIYPTGELINL